MQRAEGRTVDVPRYIEDRSWIAIVDTPTEFIFSLYSGLCPFFQVLVTGAPVAIMAELLKKPAGQCVPQMSQQNDDANWHILAAQFHPSLLPTEMQKTESSVMRSLDAEDSGVGKKKQRLEFPDTLEGFNYAFNDGNRKLDSSQSHQKNSLRWYRVSELRRVTRLDFSQKESCGVSMMGNRLSSSWKTTTTTIRNDTKLWERWVSIETSPFVKSDTSTSQNQRRE